jgi:hypothetical protein
VITEYMTMRNTWPFFGRDGFIFTDSDLTQVT